MDFDEYKMITSEVVYLKVPVVNGSVFSTVNVLSLRMDDMFTPLKQMMSLSIRKEPIYLAGQASIPGHIAGVKISQLSLLPVLIWERMFLHWSFRQSHGDC